MSNIKINITKNKEGQLSKDLNKLTGFKVTPAVKKEIATLEKKLNTSH